MQARAAAAAQAAGVSEESWSSPWAEVYIDGKYTDTTPFSQGALSIPEGEHKIELKNPFFVRETRKISIKRGATATLKVALAKK